MKKKILTAIIIAGTGMANISAQNDFKKESLLTGGLKLEANLSNFILSGTSVTAKKNLGVTFGGFLNLDISKHFALQGELIYHYKSSDLSRDDEKNKFQYLGMEIPMYAVYQWKFKNRARLYAGLGPYTEFGFSARVKKDGKWIDLYKKNEATDMSIMFDTNSGFGLMAGYEFASGLQMNIGYKVSITNVLDANSASFSMFPQTISLGIGYRFGQ
jgi:opacity protein-like surface antigen